VRRAIRGLLSHAVAALASLVLLTLMPTVAYALLAAMSLATQGDLGGPLNLILVPAASLVGALAFTAFSFVVVLLVRAAQKRRGFGAWLPAAGAFLLGGALGLLAAAARSTPGLARPALAGALLFGLAFNAYWLPFSSVHALLGRLRRKPAAAP